MKITILFGGECPLPPEAIGAVEILWFNVGLLLAEKGHNVTLIGKGDASFPRDRRNFRCKIVHGFIPSRYRIVTLFRALVNSFRMLRLVAPCDILVVNNAWAVLLMKILGRKRFRKVLVNVARMPKDFFWLRNNGADVFVCPSSSVAKMVSQIIPARMASRIVVVPNPVDLRHFNRDLYSGGADSCHDVIVYHGRIHREKGLHLLASAVRDLRVSYPNIRLKLIGAIDESRGGSGIDYKNELNGIFGEGIEWVSPLADRERLAKEIASGDIYCYPSLAENGETFGVAPLEAMGLGLPVVVSALECFQDFVEDGISGLVFNHRSENAVAELRQCLNHLLSNSAMRKRLSMAGAAAALNFSTEHVANRYADLFDNLVH